MRSSFFGSVLLGAFFSAGILLACSSDDDAGSSGGGGGDAGVDRRLAQPFVPPNASCPVVIESPAILESPHVPEGTVITYNSNPPSSGPHYPVWAQFQEFDKPIDHGYLVHSMEHGAVVLLYKCQSPTEAACVQNVEALRKVRDAVKADPLCVDPVRARVILAPDPRIDRPVAAAAWGWTYKADCVDAPTLGAFIAENYAIGPENFCSPGRTF
ncbi:MAG: DUF3105 domain-containing protein [Labilithrix sp.]|nr:DUF3105 domain-containing protein [Labilithrix sp.]